MSFEKFFSADGTVAANSATSMTESVVDCPLALVAHSETKVSHMILPSFGVEMEVSFPSAVTQSV